MCKYIKIIRNFIFLLFLFGYVPSLLAKAWYVQGGAPLTSDGSLQHPFYSLKQAENVSKPNDTIFILPSFVILDGGITLKEGQKLLGTNKVYCNSLESFDCQDNQKLSLLTHSNGDAVTLANNTIVSGLKIINPGGYAIFGKNINSSIIKNNTITGTNHRQLLQENFVLSPEFRGFITFRISSSDLGSSYNSEFFPRSAIGFIGTSSSKMNLLVESNIIKGTEEADEILGNYGPGVSLLMTDNAQAKLTISKNLIMDSALIPNIVPNYTSGIYLYLSGQANASVLIEDTSVKNLERSNDGIDAINVDDSQLEVMIRRYHFIGKPSQGLFSQGLEAITAYGMGKFASLVGGTNKEHHANMVLRLEKSTITNSASVGFLVCSFLNRSPYSIFDLGGGFTGKIKGFLFNKGSEGKNRIYNNSTAQLNSDKNITIINARVFASNNWWGYGTTITTKDNKRMLNLKYANVCGVNFKEGLCNSEKSQLITVPALVLDPIIWGAFKK